MNVYYSSATQLCNKMVFNFGTTKFNFKLLHLNLIETLKVQL